MPLATRALGSFSLAGGPVAAPVPTGPVPYRETDAFIQSPVDSDAAVVAHESDVTVLGREADAEVVHGDTDVDVYF